MIPKLRSYLFGLVLGLLLFGCKKPIDPTPGPNPTPSPVPVVNDIQRILAMLKELSQLIADAKTLPTPPQSASPDIADLRREIAAQSAAIKELKELGEHFKRSNPPASGSNKPDLQATIPTKPLVVLFTAPRCSDCIKAKKALTDAGAAALPFAWEERAYFDRPKIKALQESAAPILWWSETADRPSEDSATRIQTGFSTLDNFLSVWRQNRKVLFVQGE